MREPQSRRRVKTLRRKHALPLAVLKPRPLAQQLCTQRHTAAANNRPVPESQPFIKRIADSGLRLTTFTSLHKSLTRHQGNKTTPKPIEIVQAFPPQAATGHPARLFHRVPPHGNPIPYTADQNRRNTGTIRTILPIP